MEFDETDAIKTMQQAVSASYDDDQLLNIIDMIFDYYESNGLLEIDCDDEDDDVDTDAIIDYVKRMLRRDKGASVADSDVEPLVKAYLDYEESVE